MVRKFQLIVSLRLKLYDNKTSHRENIERSTRTTFVSALLRYYNQ